MGNRVGIVLRSLAGRRRAVLFITRPRQEDMVTLRDLLATGTIRPVVERTYPLAHVAQALTYLGTRHARAKLVLVVA
jgi:NADPH:quinone reductase-like Zn-dependent oxidoreductase